MRDGEHVRDGHHVCMRWQGVVNYDATGFLEKNRDTLTADMVRHIIG